MKRYVIIVSTDDTMQYAKLLEVTEKGTRELVKFSSHDWYNDGALELAKERLIEFKGLVEFDVVKI